MRRGFTLIELLVVLAIGVILIVLAAPSFSDFIQMQRLRSVAAQFATDVKLARSEAPSRQRQVHMAIKHTPQLSCYIVYTCFPTDSCTPCDCEAAEGARCPRPEDEIRTQQLPASLGLRIRFNPTGSGGIEPLFITFEPAAGSMTVTYPVLFSGPVSGPANVAADISLLRDLNPPSVRTDIAATGRPTQCSPSGRVSSMAACPVSAAAP